MHLTVIMMLGSYILSLFHFLYSYKEAIRISQEEGKVNGWPLVFCLPLAVIFAYFAGVYYEKLF
ncbi:hypothetical protein [Metabacillus sp. RGM 3146]|uniref:hypothetical protein n=1 Tax=Metabacillus sp. RGM 3146 TaxID=3401092 RepID=UPI003B98E52D